MTNYSPERAGLLSAGVKAEHTWK